MKIEIVKKTDQLNYEDFLGGVTRIVTIAGVKKSKAESQYDIEIEGDTRAWRPPPTVLKQLVGAWTDETDTWIGRRAELYGDPEVMMAGKKVGGIRVTRLSHIDKPLTMMLTTTRSQKAPFTVDPLPELSKRDALAAEWKATNDPERRAAIEAEVAKLGESA